MHELYVRTGIIIGMFMIALFIFFMYFIIYF